MAQSLPQRALGKSGINVSAIGLGCMSFSGTYGTSDDDQSVVVIHAAIEQEPRHVQVRAEPRGTAGRRGSALTPDELLPQRVLVIQGRKQRRRPVRCCDVHIHAGIQQNPHRLQVVFLHREQH